MTRSEREQLVEQYLEGSMDFAQEENFFIQVALDDELRRTLKSYRIVDEAIRKERDSGMRDHATARYAVAGMLLASPQPVPQEAEAGQALPHPSASGAGILKRMVSRRVVAAAATVGLMIFGWMGIEQISDPPKQTGAVSRQGSDIGKRQEIQATPATEQNPAMIQEAPLQTKQTPVIERKTPEAVNRSGSERTEAGQNSLSINEGATTPRPAASVPAPNPTELRIDTAQKSPNQQHTIELPTDVEWKP